MSVVVSTAILDLTIMAIGADGNECAGIEVLSHFSGIPFDEQIGPLLSFTQISL